MWTKLCWPGSDSPSGICWSSPRTVASRWAFHRWSCQPAGALHCFPLSRWCWIHNAERCSQMWSSSLKNNVNISEWFYAERHLRLLHRRNDGPWHKLSWWRRRRRQRRRHCWSLPSDLLFDRNSVVHWVALMISSISLKYDWLMNYLVILKHTWRRRIHQSGISLRQCCWL